MIQTNNIKKHYLIGDKKVEAVNGISIDFKDNGMYIFLGKSGCGKTTLLNLLAGLDSYDSGKIYFDGKEISYYHNNELDNYHNLDIGIVFQEHNLLPALTVYDNLKIVLEIQNWDGKNESYIDKHISETLSRVGLNGYEKRKITELSGGERQRVAIARAIVKQPKVIFADEPTGNLDVNTSKTIFEVLKNISKEFIVVMVTHDRDSAFEYGDYIYEMSNGIISDSNNQNKKKSFYYSLTLKCDETEYVFSELSYNQVCELIGEKVYNSSKESKIEIFNVSKEHKYEEETRNTDVIKEKAKTCKLSMKYKMQLAFMFLSKKKVTLIMTIILMAISTVLIYSAAIVTYYDDVKTIKSYLNEYEPEILPVYIEAEYVDDFFERHQKNSGKGREFISLSEKVTDYADCIKVALDEEINDADISAFFVPMKKDGVVITDYVAVKNGIKHGDVISYRGIEFEVIEIIETDYLEYNLITKLEYGADSSHLDHYYNYKYNVAYFSQDLINEPREINNVRILLEHSDFTLYNREISYIRSEYYYFSADEIIESDLICGRLPQNDNEVVVSSDFAMFRMQFDGESFNEREYQYINMYDDKYNNYYANDLNLYNYFTDGIKVVGIVSDEKLSVDADVFIHDTKWEEICDDYYRFYFANNSYHVKENQYNEFVNLIDEYGYKIDEPAINQIYAFKNIVKTIKPVIFILLIFTLILDIVLVITFINISIRENRKNVGILRALGIPIKTIGNIFEIEFWVIHVISIIFSIPLISFVQMVSNNEYSKILTDNPYDIIKWNYLVMAIIIVVKTLIGYGVTNIPIRKCEKNKIVELMR